MAEQVTNYKCPACTGPLRYDGASGKLQCDYCGSSFDVKYIEDLYAEQDAQAAAAAEAEAKKEEAEAAKEDAAADITNETQTTDAEGVTAEAADAETAEEAADEGSWDTTSPGEEWGPGEGMKAYNCPSCGAELICDETTAATRCPYCGNPTVIPGQFTGGRKPELVLPFVLDQKQAEAALKKHYEGKKLLPKAFTEEQTVREIKGVYVPFWLFDATAEVDAAYDGTTRQTGRSGQEQITEVRYYDVRRAGTVTFEKVPVDASSRMPDDYMDALEPYDYSKLQPFSAAFLPGFLADRYDVTAEEAAERADTRIKSSAMEAIDKTVTGYAGAARTSANIRLLRGKVHYALIPAYLLTIKWNGQDYLFAVNGQNGRAVGELPASDELAKKYLLKNGLITGIIAAVIITLIRLLT